MDEQHTPNVKAAGSSPAGATTYEVRTIDGVFLALRYDLEAAYATARDFQNRWPHVVVTRVER